MHRLGDLVYVVISIGMQRLQLGIGLGVYR